MSGIRRSTRLNSVGAETPATPKRRTEMWRMRQTKTETSEESENESPKKRSMIGRKSKSNLVVEEKAVEVTKMPKDHVNRPGPLSKKKEWQELDNKRKIEVQRRLDCTNKDQQDVSPPKMTRRDQQPIPKHLVSPSRLIERLSIDHDSNENNDETVKIEEKTAKPKLVETSPIQNKYQNARRVLNSAETEHLPGREKQMQELRDFLTEHLQNESSGSLYVSGQPGTGKTACLSLLLRSPEFSKQFQKAYINCTSIASIGSVYKKLCTELNINVHGRTERDHLDAIKRHLRTTKRMSLIVLDEIDQLCSSRQSVLYTIFEWPSLPGARLILIGIANSLDLTDRALIRLNARIELKPRLMHFPPYTKQEIVEIFRSRLEQADVLDVFPPVTLQLLAAKVSAISGDVRRALDIGRRVVEIAEQKKKAGQRVTNVNELNIGNDNNNDADSLKPVQVTQVVEVLNKVYGASQKLEEDIESSFPLQQKLMLCTLMLMLRNEKNKDINMGRLHEVYRRVCNKRNICALDQAEFAGLVDLVETRGILRIIPKKERRLSKVQLQWDEDEVNAALSDKQLIATILNDTACLRNNV